MQRLRLKSVDPTTAPRFLLVAGLFLSPSFFDLGSVKPFDVPKVAVLWFFGWLAFGLTVIEILRGKIRPVRFRLGLVGAIFLASAAVSTLFSVTRGVSFFGWYGRYNGFVVLALYVAIFWLLTQLYWRRPERLKEIFYAIAAASIVLCVYVLVQWAGIDPIKWIQPNGLKVFRYFGTMGNSDFAGGYLGATFGWLVFAFWRAKRLLTKALVVGWALVTAFALWETSSRDGLAALFATGCVAVFLFRHRLPRLITIAAGLLAALVVVAGLGLASYSVRHVKPSPAPTLATKAQQGAPGVLRTGTFVVRTFWWRAALRVFAARPLFGAGPDTFVVEYPHYALAKAADLRGTERTDEPHNILLERTSSLGIFGIGSYLALIFLGLRWGSRRMRALRNAGGDSLESELLGTFLVMAAAYLTQGFFSIDVAALATVGWVSFAGIAALADPAVVAARSRLAFGEGTPPRIGPARRATAVVVMVLVAVVSVAGLRPWLADRAAKQAQRDAAETASTDIVMSSYKRAMSLVPYDPIYRGLAANFLTTQAQQIDDKDVQTDLLTQAVELEKQMDRLQPGNAFWKTTIATGLAALAAISGDVSSYEESEAWFSDAARLAPYDYRVSLQHGLMLNRWGRATHDGLKYCQAISEFNASNALRPQVEVAAGLGQAYAAIGHIDEALAAMRAGLQVDFDPKHKQLSTLITRVEALRKRGVKVINCG